jgi:hypothetical protein
MAEAATKMPVGKEERGTDPAEWRPFESLRREVDRPFEDFQLGSWRSPFGRSVFECTMPPSRCRRPFLQLTGEPCARGGGPR